MSQAGPTCGIGPSNTRLHLMNRPCQLPGKIEFARRANPDIRQLIVFSMVSLFPVGNFLRILHELHV
jgi:hypothetical protein